MDIYLSDLGRPSKVNSKTFKKVEEIKFTDLPYYLTDKYNSTVKHVIFGGDKIPQTLNLNDFDIYLSIGEMNICFYGITVKDSRYKDINLNDVYEVESLNSVNDFVTLKDEDIVLVTRKDSNGLVARGRYFRSKFNSTELSWGRYENLEFFEFNNDLYNFYKLIGIK